MYKYIHKQVHDEQGRPQVSNNSFFINTVLFYFMQKCTDREDDTENCTITAQCQMLELISCWNIKKKKKIVHLWKGETKK